jgi:hypothetical protein
MEAELSHRNSLQEDTPMETGKPENSLQENATMETVKPENSLQEDTTMETGKPENPEATKAAILPQIIATITGTS